MVRISSVLRISSQSVIFAKIMRILDSIALSSILSLIFVFESYYSDSFYYGNCTEIMMLINFYSSWGWVIAKLVMVTLLAREIENYY